MVEVKDLEGLKGLISRVRKAQEEFSTFDQETVDKIFRKVAQRINDERITLSKMAVEETGMGIIEDKMCIRDSFTAGCFPPQLIAKKIANISSTTVFFPKKFFFIKITFFLNKFIFLY